MFIALRLRTNDPTTDYHSGGEDKSRPSESICVIPNARSVSALMLVGKCVGRSNRRAYAIGLLSGEKRRAKTMLPAAHHWLIVALILSINSALVPAQDARTIAERNKRVQNLQLAGAKFVFDEKDKTRPPIQITHGFIDRRIETEHRAAIADIAGLTTLRSVILSGASDEDLAKLVPLTRLTSLTVYSKGVTDEAFKSIAKFEKLEALDLSGTRVFEKAGSLSSLKKLERLSLAGTPTSDVGLKALKDVKSLRHLNIERTAVTSEGLKHLGKLESLWVDGTAIGDAAFAEISHCDSLRSLSVRDHAVTDVGLRYLEDLPNLRSLAIHRYGELSQDGIFALQRKKPKLKIQSN